MSDLVRPRRNSHNNNQIQQLRHRKKQRHQFLEGSLVEVSSYEPDFKGVWFLATIINLPTYRKGNPNYGKFYVQYKDILDDEDNTKLHRDYVNAALVRPLPPVDNHPGSFKIGDKVDAFCKDGWWTGVVTGVCDESMFHVTFQDPPDEAMLRSSDIRIHRVWIKGSWVPPVNQDVSFPSDESNIVNIDNNIGVNIDNNIGYATPPSNSVSMTSSFEEQTPFSSNSRENNFELAALSSEPLVIDPSPMEMNLDSLPSIGKEALNGEAHAFVPSPGTNVYKSGTTSDDVASQDYVTVENDIHRQLFGGADQSHESYSLHKRGNTKRVRMVENEENTLVGSRKTEENMAQVKKLQNSAGGKVGNVAEDVAEDVRVDSLTVNTNLSVVLGLACDNSRTSGSKRSYRSNGEEKVTDQFEVINGSQKKRRGRPPKSLDKPLPTSILDFNVEASAEASALGHVVGTNGTYVGASSDHIMQDNQSGIKSVPLPSRIGSEKNHQSGMKSVTSPSRIGSETSVEASRKQRGKHPTVQDRKRTTKLNLTSKVHDVASPGSEEEGYTAEANYMNEESDRDTEGSPDNSVDNLPLSKWIGSLRSPASIDSSGSSLIKNIAEVSGEHMEIVKEGTAAVEEIRQSSIVLQNLPFEKKSTLWSSLESMDVFQKLPQKLHFQPLEHVKESLREGLAVGYMVTFSGIVEKTSKLRFDEPTKCSTDDILETLLELETHGFDVGCIRERLNKLVQMKEKQEKLEEEVEKLNNEMAEQELEKSKMEEEMEGIKKQIQELQEKLSMAVSVTQIKSGEIESLQLKLKDRKEGISSIRRELEGQSSWP